MAQAVFAALADQATTRFAKAPSHAKPPLYDTPRLATHLKTFIRQDRKRDAVAFVQTCLDKLDLDTCCTHLKEHLCAVYSAFVDPSTDESTDDHYTGDEEHAWMTCWTRKAFAPSLRSTRC